MPQRISGRLRGVQPTVAQVLSLLQVLISVGGCAVPAPRASKAQRRCRSGRRAAARRRARMPSRTRAGAPARRPRSRRSPRPATQAPLETSPRIRRESNTMPRVCRTPITASSGAIRTSAPAAKGGPLSRCGRGRVLAAQQDHRERSITRRALRERHRPGCHDESAPGRARCQPDGHRLRIPVPGARDRLPRKCRCPDHVRQLDLPAERIAAAVRLRRFRRRHQRQSVGHALQPADTQRQARAAACQREAELNRRFAPDVYLGVMEVRDPAGRVCDQLVAMRRMLASRRLSALIQACEPVSAAVAPGRADARRPACVGAARPGDQRAR